MIPLQYQQLAWQIHQERIQTALRPRPEWPLRVDVPSTRPSFNGWSQLKRFARWPTLVFPRAVIRRA